MKKREEALTVFFDLPFGLKKKVEIFFSAFFSTLRPLWWKSSHLWSLRRDSYESYVIRKWPIKDCDFKLHKFSGSFLLLLQLCSLYQLYQALSWYKIWWYALVHLKKLFASSKQGKKFNLKLGPYNKNYNQTSWSAHNSHNRCVYFNKYYAFFIINWRAAGCFLVSYEICLTLFTTRLIFKWIYFHIV